MNTTVEDVATDIAAPQGGSFLIKESVAGQVLTPEDFSEMQHQVFTTAKEFMNGEVIPRIAEFEQKQEGLALELIQKSAELGLLGILVPESYGGLEMDITTQMLVSECVGSYASFSTTYGAQCGIGTLPIVYFGTEQQKQHYLPRLIRAELIAAYCLSEPQAGSDALASLTRAELTPDGKNYVLNGQKMWISNGDWADLFTVFAKVDGIKFTAFLVERSYEGVKPGNEEHKMGIRGSSTTALYLDDVHVPVENVLGEIGRGHIIAFNVLNIGRLKLGAACVGSAKNLIAESVSYALQRKAFGQPIANFGAIRQKLADMVALTFAGESLVYRTSGMIDSLLGDFSWEQPDAAGTMLQAIEEYAVECSIAKVYLSESLDSIADEAVQIHGGYGYHQDYSVERVYRDSRINRIFEGTNEINRLLITGMLLKRTAQGRLDLMGAILQLQSQSSAEPVDTPSNGHSNTAHPVLLYRARKGTLMMAGVAYQRFGSELEQQQQIAAALAEMVIAVYAAESAMLRAQKLSTTAHRDFADDLVTVIIHQTMNTIREQGDLVLGACSSGPELATSHATFLKLVHALPTDIPVARNRIASRVLEVGHYSL